MIKLRKILESMDTESTAGICLFYDSKLLACKRTDSYWSIPKGHLHIGEVPSEGVQRELTEETQIVLNNNQKTDQQPLHEKQDPHPLFGKHHTLPRPTVNVSALKEKRKEGQRVYN